jgi:hypothetical protein
MTRYADAVGTRIAYDTVGSGPDLIFLHAGIADPQPAGSAVAQLRHLT